MLKFIEFGLLLPTVPLFQNLFSYHKCHRHKHVVRKVNASQAYSFFKQVKKTKVSKFFLCMTLLMTEGVVRRYSNENLTKFTWKRDVSQYRWFAVYFIIFLEEILYRTPVNTASDLTKIKFKVSRLRFQWISTEEWNQ